MWAAIGPPRRHKTYSLYALFLSIFCRNTAAFFFFSSSNSRFNSLTIAISFGRVAFGNGFSAEIAPVFPGIVGHDASQKRKEYSECYNTNVRRKGTPAYLCKTRPVVQICLQFRLVTISIAKTKAELWPSSPPPLLCATSSG